MKWFMILVKIFIIGALLIISNGNLAMKEKANREAFYDQYSIWFNELVDKGFSLTGEAMRMDWLPDKALSLNNNSPLNLNG